MPGGVVSSWQKPKHDWHDALPVPASKVPAVQGMHGPLPMVSLYFPAEHAAHGPPFGPVYPTLHAQSVLPAAELEFPGQSVDTAEPEPALYSPAGHNTHVAPSDAVAPALQVQSVMRADS
jgi:hypothetical protein